MLSILALAAALAAAPVYTPRLAPSASQGSPAVPDATLSDAEVHRRLDAYLRGIDVPIAADQWRALGSRAVPLLERVLGNLEQLPSRRAKAAAGLSAIGGDRARALVLEVARSDTEPFAVRGAALRGAASLLPPKELAQQIQPVLEGAREPATRAMAAEVLARHAPELSCGAVHAQANREPERARFRRAIERCGAAGP
jgi:hypothetical protein